MKRTALILASGSLLALSLSPAAAGQCGNEIDTFSKLLAAHDAGSGPTSGAPGSAMGQHPPTSAMSQADQGGTASQQAAQSEKPQHPPTAVMNRETTGAAPSASPPSRESHPPTDVMNKETQGSAASSQDVQRQTQGQPTAAQQAQGQASLSRDKSRAMTALDEARAFDQQGKEAECVAALGRAKLMFGLK